MSEYGEYLADIVRRKLNWGHGDFELVDPRESDDVELVRPTLGHPNGSEGCYLTGRGEHWKVFNLPQGTAGEPLSLWDACAQAQVKPGAIVCYWGTRSGVPQARRVTFYPDKRALPAAETRRAVAAHEGVRRSGGRLWIDGHEPDPGETGMLLGIAAALPEIGPAKAREIIDTLGRLAGGKYMIRVNLTHSPPGHLEYFAAHDDDEDR